MPWRPGRHNSRIIYRQTGTEPSDADQMVGTFFSPTDAAEAVTAVNRAARVAQLEKIAELARRLPPAVGASAGYQDQLLLLELALTDLDNHPDTRTDR